MSYLHKPSLRFHRAAFLTIILLALSLSLSLAACSATAPPEAAQTQSVQPVVASNPSPTPLVSTQAAGSSSILAATNTPAIIPVSTNSVQAQTLISPDSGQAEAPVQIDFGTADLAIIRPGQFSRHTSPIRIIANLNTLLPLETEITLYGEDGRVLASKQLWSKPYNDPINGNLITDIEFSIPVVAETGRLELKALDSSGRVWALNSVYLILLSRGITDRNYAPESQDRILLQLPMPGQRQVNSSPMFISGLVRTQSDAPLTIWLIDETGNTVGEGQASVVLTPGSAYAQFVGEIPYQVSEATNVLMTIGLQEGRISGFTYIKTIEFTLLPVDN